MSWSCGSALLSDKKVYPTFTRISAPWTLLAPMFNAIADFFGWNRVGLITDSTNLFRLTAEATKKDMEASGKKVFFYTIEPTQDGNDINEAAYAKQKQTMQTLKNLARVIFVLTFANDVRNILVTAYDEGMLSAGYSYIAMEIGGLLNIQHHFRPELGDFLFDGVMMGIPLSPSDEKWAPFAHEVLDRFNHPTFRDWPHLPATADPSEVPVLAGK